MAKHDSDLTSKEWPGGHVHLFEQAVSPAVLCSTAGDADALAATENFYISKVCAVVIYHVQFRSSGIGSLSSGNYSS